MLRLQSTLIKLLTRLYEPTEGEILVNDEPISSYSHSELLKNITVQLQHVPVANVTIAEFVGLGAAARRADRPVDVVAVERALRKADAMPFIDRLDKGIWARLGPVSDQVSLHTRTAILTDVPLNSSRLVPVLEPFSATPCGLTNRLRTSGHWKTS